MPLPLPYAPNIDVDAERLRMAREQGARPPVDVGASVAPAISGALALQQALDDKNKKEAARIVQQEYIDKGLDGARKAWEEAGSPAGKNPDAYFFPNMTTEQTRDAGVAYLKDLTDWKTKDTETKGRGEFAKSYLERGGDKAVAAGVESGILKPETVITEEGKSKREKEASDNREKIASIRAVATKTAASIRQALQENKDAGAVAAIERENQRLADIEAEITSAESDTTMSSGAIRRLTDRLNREASSIDSRISAYMTRVSDPSKIPVGIRKPGGGGGTNKKGVYNPITGLIEYK